MSNKNIIYQQIRNATVKIKYHDLTLLVDPYLVPKGASGCFAICPNPEMRKIKNPICELPMPINEILKEVDAVIVTHTHGDHWDEDAAKNIPTNIPIFVQNESDKNIVQNQGFKDVRIVDIDTPFKGITITKNEGQHGTDDVIKHFGKGFEVCMGFVLKAPEEKTIYFTGDTIWTKNFETAVEKYEPDYIVMNAALPLYEGIEGSSTMGQEDIKKCCDMYKKLKVIVTHLDSLAHCFCTSKTVKKLVDENNISDRVIIPKDGETVTL